MKLLKYICSVTLFVPLIFQLQVIRKSITIIIIVLAVFAVTVVNVVATVVDVVVVVVTVVFVVYLACVLLQCTCLGICSPDFLIVM